MKYEFHEVASVFPMMSDEQFDGLKNDIKENGQREPIWIYQDKIIDGRNRYVACEQLGIEAKVRQWDGNGSLVSFVVSLNLHRRHLDASQLGMVGARVREIFEDDARKRMTTGTNQYSPSIKRCEGNKGRSSVKAAEKELIFP